MAEAVATPPAPTTPPPAPVAAPPPVTPPAPDPRFAALAKKEEAVVAQQQQLASDRAAHAKEIADAADFKKRMENALRDPDSFLKPVYGEKWIEKLNEYRLNANTVTPELLDQHVERRVSTLEQRLADQRAADKEAELKQQRTDWQTGIVDFVKAAPEYELINAYDAQHLVHQTIEAHFAQTQKLLSPKEAAEQVEKDLEERARKTKKFAVAAPKPGERTPGSSSTTLTAAMTATTPGSEVVGRTAEERIQRAIKAAEAVEARNRARQTS